MKGTPFPLPPALLFFDHFFVDFSVLLIFGVYKNQLSLVVIISNNYINQIVSINPWAAAAAAATAAAAAAAAASSSSSSSSSGSISSLSLQSLSVSEDLKHAINCFF